MAVKEPLKINIDDTNLNNIPQDTFCCSLAVCNPKRSIHRYFALIFMCFIGFGSYYCYDTPGSLQKQIINDMRVSTFDFSNLYAWYSWPNVVLCFIGGFLIDKMFGIRLGAVIFSSTILIGQLVFALGAFLNKFWLMELGRFISGIGGESLGIAQTAYAVSWFKGKELNMVFGLQLSLGRMGASINFLLTPAIYKFSSLYLEGGHSVLGLTLLVTSVTCIISLVSALIMGLFDWRAEKILKKSLVQAEDKIQLSDIKEFPCTFWLITAVCVTYYGAVFPFIGLGTVFFAQKYSLNQSAATTIDGILYIVAAVAPPAIGYVIDKTGQNLMWVFTAVFFTLVSHILLGLTFINPWVTMIAMGFSYSILACSLWPMVALVIPEHQIGTAYGIMQSTQNLGLAVVAIVAGAIVDYKGYIFLEIFFIYCLIASVMSIVMLYIVDTRKQGCLNMTVSARGAKNWSNQTNLPENAKLPAYESIDETGF